MPESLADPQTLPRLNGGRRNGRRSSPDDAGSKPLTARDWVEAALDMLSSGGIDAVRVDPLSKTLGVTRGSFYWHFKDRAELHRAMLVEWTEKSNLRARVRLDKSNETPRKLLMRILSLPHANPRSSRGARIELAMRHWAQRDEAAALAVREIDTQRLRYFGQLLKQNGVSRERAQARAFLFYAALMGEAYISTGNRAELIAACQDLLLDPE